MKLFSLSEFQTKAMEAFKRFPFTLVWAILSTAVLIVFVEQDRGNAFDTYANFAIVAILGISWLIGAQFYIEQFKRKGLWWIKVIIVILLIAFYFTLPTLGIDAPDSEATPYIRWLLYLIAGHLTLFFAPFITVWHPKAYWNYLGRMMTALSRSVLFSGVLYLGLVLALLAVQYLFDVTIEGRRYFQLFIICLGIVNTWVYLSDFPKEIQHNIHITFPKAAEVFVKFILIPLAALYIIILYAYTLKIIIQWELPKGWVSYLVTALAGLLFVIRFIINPVRISHESRIIRKFHPLAHWLLLPLLVLLFTAIYKRVSDYGITETRYFLILIAVFITGATLYLIFSRKQQLRYLPIALAVMALLGSFGFWGAFSVSKRSQLEEFEKVYTAFAKAEKNTPINTIDYNRFRSITNYLSERNAYNGMEEVLGYNPKTAFPDVNTRRISRKILDSLGLKTENEGVEERSLNFNYRSTETYAVKGYTWSKAFAFNLSNTSHYIEEGYSLRLSPNGQSILIEKQNNTTLELPTKPLIQELQSSDEETKKREQLQITASTEDIDVKIYFDSLNLRRDTGILVINYADGVVLLNTKQ